MMVIGEVTLGIKYHSNNKHEFCNRNIVYMHSNDQSEWLVGHCYLLNFAYYRQRPFHAMVQNEEVG